MRSSADDVWMTYVPADDVHACGQHADDVRTCGWHADNVQTMCRRCPDDICHPPAEISNEVSLLCCPHIVCASSAHCLHVIRHEISTQNISSQRAENSSAKNEEVLGSVSTKVLVDSKYLD